jgi:hypothetical protein
VESLAVVRSLTVLRERLERLLEEEDDLRRSLARKREQPDPPAIELTPDLIRLDVVARRRRGRPRNTGRREDWIQARLADVRKRREEAARRLVDAADTG